VLPPVDVHVLLLPVEMEVAARKRRENQVLREELELQPGMLPETKRMQ